LLHGHLDTVSLVAFRPDEKSLVSFSLDHTARVWDWHNGDELRVITKQENQFKALSQDGETMVSFSKDGYVGLWDVNSGEELAVLDGPFLNGTSTTFSPDGRKLATSSTKGFLIWDISAITNNVDISPNSRVFRGHSSAVTRATMSPNGDMLASASEDGEIRLWSAIDGDLRFSLLGHSDLVSTLTFSPDGQRLMSKGTDGRICLWDTRNGKNLLSLSKQWIRYSSDRSLSPDGTILATISTDSFIHLWDTSNLQEIKRLQGQVGADPPLAFSPDGKLLASDSKNHSVHLWEIASGKQLAQFKGHTGMIMDIAFNPDGKTLASASWDDTIRLWDLDEMNERTVLEGHTAGVRKIDFSPSEELLFSMAYDNTIRCWDIESGVEYYQFPSPASLNDFSISPDGSLLSVATEPGSIFFIDALELQFLSAFKAHQQAITSISFSSDSKTLISTSADKTIRLWSIGDVDSSFLLDRLRAYFDLGLSYSLEMGGQSIPKDPLQLAKDRLNAAEKSGIPWLDNGGKEYVSYFKNQLERIQMVKQKWKTDGEAFNEKKSSLYTPEQILWFAKTLSGATLADGHITSEETSFLENDLEWFKKEPEASEIIKKNLDSRIVSKLESISTNSAFSNTVFYSVLYISIGDLELHNNELEFIEQVTQALFIDNESRSSIMKYGLNLLTTETLLSIQEKLDQTEQSWLSTMAIQIIQSDGIIDEQEKKTINTLSRLQLIDSSYIGIIDNGNEIKLKPLPQIDLQPEVSLKILRFLAELTISETGIHQEELNYIRTVGELLKIKPDRVNDIISAMIKLESWLR
jgi:WD40 repeat protein/uncharacterized membrane protein YebE (DUF533 family)